MFRRSQQWAAGDWQLHHNNVPVHASHLVHRFWSKYQITQVTQSPYGPDLAPCDFWLFLKLTSFLKRKRFQTINEIKENMTGQMMVIGKSPWDCVRSQGTYFERDWSIIFLCTVYLVSCTFFNKCLYFSYFVTEYFLDRPFRQSSGFWLKISSESICFWMFLLPLMKPP